MKRRFVHTAVPSKRSYQRSSATHQFHNEKFTAFAQMISRLAFVPAQMSKKKPRRSLAEASLTLSND
jgi:hypothetical protein